MIHKPFCLALILAAFVAVPALAGDRVVLTGTLERASIIEVQAETVGGPSASHVERRAVLLIGDGRRAVLDFSGSLTADRGVLVRNRDGSEVVVYPGEAVRVVASLTCLEPGGNEPCRLEVVRFELR